MSSSQQGPSFVRCGSHISADGEGISIDFNDSQGNSTMSAPQVARLGSHISADGEGISIGLDERLSERHSPASMEELFQFHSRTVGDLDVEVRGMSKPPTRPPNSGPTCHKHK